MGKMTLFSRIKHFLRRIPRIYSIIVRGWCDCDTWNLDSNIASNILPRLKHFKENTCSFPSDLDNMDQWHYILDQIIYSMEISNKCDQFDDDIDWITVKYGHELFGKYFRALWS